MAGSRCYFAMERASAERAGACVSVNDEKQHGRPGRISLFARHTLVITIFSYSAIGPLWYSFLLLKTKEKCLSLFKDDLLIDS